jgi:hypothetical protein
MRTHVLREARERAAEWTPKGRKTSGCIRACHARRAAKLGGIGSAKALNKRARGGASKAAASTAAAETNTERAYMKQMAIADNAQKS